MANKSADELVLEMLVKVDRKKKEIAKAKVRPTWKTNCSFGKDPNSSQDRMNIQVIKEPRKLIEICAFLNGIQGSLNTAAQELGFDFDGTWLNYSINDWKDDLKTRASQLTIEKKQKELDELDERVNKLVSPEQRRVMELTALQEILKD